MPLKKTKLITLVVMLLAGLFVWQLYDRLGTPSADSARKKISARTVPVEVAVTENGPIELRRSFTGTLNARAEFAVAPKVGGRIEQLDVDVADTVERGQLVARLDNAEYVQAVNQARADLAVAKANLAEAGSLLKIAERELARLDKLRESGVSSASRRDTAKADQLAKQAHVEVTRAQVKRAEAELETARIRLGYTEVTADWRGGSEQRVVAERFVDEGETVTANASLIRIVELDPLIAVLFVTERDYALLHQGQTAQLTTDAYRDLQFQGQITRIAPVFRENVRQARVELQVENPGQRLKPGMFVRATVVLDRVEDATIVPEQALVTRDGKRGVFLLAEDKESVIWRVVRTGIRQESRVQVTGEKLSSHVVVLGQQLLDDNTPVTVVNNETDIVP